MLLAIGVVSRRNLFAETTPKAGKASRLDGLATAAVAHVCFETIHPFEDGNGRIGRAIVDMAIAQDHDSSVRLYSLSRELLESGSAYYDTLNQAQRGHGDVTHWVVWFVEQFAAACARSSTVIDSALEKSRFWADHAGVDINCASARCCSGCSTTATADSSVA